MINASVHTMHNRNRTYLLVNLVVAATLAASFTAPQGAAETTSTIYDNDFAGPLGGEWSGAGRLPTPTSEWVLAGADGRPFDRNDAATLTLTRLPAHDTVVLSLRLYTLRSMDGNHAGNAHCCSPDRWDVDATGTDADIQSVTTFANYAWMAQDYPAPFLCGSTEPDCEVAHTGTTGSAAAGDLLGLGTSGNSEIPAVRYDLEYSFAHSEDSIMFRFAGIGLQAWGDEGWVLDDVAVAVSREVAEAPIDIKPGSEPNSVNPRSRGGVPVAILSTSQEAGDALDFDASSVDAGTLLLGSGGAPAVHQGHPEDVDNDGDVDLIVHFRVADAAIRCGDDTVVLRGQTWDGQAIAGRDAIETRGCAKP